VHHRGLVGTEHDAVGGQSPRGFDHVRQGEAPETVVDVEVARQTAGHGDRTMPDVEDLLGTTEAQRDRVESRFDLVGDVAAGRVDEEVEDDRRAPHGVGEQESSPAEAGQARLGDRGGEPARDRGIEGVAPGSEREGGGRNGLGVAGGDHAARRRGGGTDGRTPRRRGARSLPRSGPRTNRAT